MIAGGIAGYFIESTNFHRDNSHFQKSRYINYMTKELQLSTTQRQEFDSIVTEVHPKFQIIRDKFNSEMHMQADSTRKMIYRILSPEQQARLQALNKQNQ